MVCHKRTFDRCHCCVGTMRVVVRLVAQKARQLTMAQIIDNRKTKMLLLLEKHF